MNAGFFEASFTGLDLSELDSSKESSESASAKLIDIKREEEHRKEKEGGDEAILQEKSFFRAEQRSERAEILKKMKDEMLMNEVSDIHILRGRDDEGFGSSIGIGCYSALASIHEADENGAKRDRQKVKRRRGLKARSSKTYKGAIKKVKRSKYCSR